jgi:hypothetical protein
MVSSASRDEISGPRCSLALPVMVGKIIMTRQKVQVEKRNDKIDVVMGYLRYHSGFPRQDDVGE